MGLLVSLPLGPMSILVIQRTANRDLKSGLYTGLGVALSDTFWSLLAGFSVSYMISFLEKYQTLIQIIGAVILFMLGLFIFNSHPIQALRKFKRKGTNPLQCFISAMLLALSNPIIVLAYIAVFAGLKLHYHVNQLLTPLSFSLGFFIGALSWWTIISLIITRLKHHFNLRILWWFNKISGIAIMLFIVVTTIIVIVKGNPTI